MTEKELRQLDAAHIWHPLTQHKTDPAPLAIKSAKGAYLEDLDGKRYLDGISSWYTCSYGHQNKSLVSALTEQAHQLHHAVFAGMTHEPVARLGKALCDILPENQQKLFFSENGSTAVEVGLKMAFQYHANLGRPRSVVVALEDGFHGDTFGAMSTSDLSVYNGPFKEFFLEVIRIPAPTLENRTEVLGIVDGILDQHQIASFIYEPLVQGAAAMQMYDPEVMGEVLSRFRESGTLLIADEVMTGFGKTGTHFASDQIKIKPDIMCLAKALTGGIMPMAITSCNQSIYDAFYDDDRTKGFFHGHTYSGNPLACSVATAAIQLLQTSCIQDGIHMISKMNAEFKTQMSVHKNIAAVRHKGTILAIDLNRPTARYGKERDRVFRWFWDRGLFLRPLGKTIYIVPPFICTRAEMEKIYNLIRKFLD